MLKKNSTNFICIKYAPYLHQKSAKCIKYYANLFQIAPKSNFSAALQKINANNVLALKYLNVYLG